MESNDTRKIVIKKRDKRQQQQQHLQQNYKRVP